MEKPINHDKNMTAVYREIYEDRYTRKPAEIAHVKMLIEKNLKEMGLSIGDLKTKTVLNVGTGVQSAALIDMGAKAVYHFDVSDHAVNSVQKLIDSDPDKYANLHTQRVDLCSDAITVPEGLDIVYLVGVAHHFWNPRAALQNILLQLNPDGRVFLRLYRSGTVKFFVADYVRRLVQFKHAPLAKKVYEDRFGTFPKGQGKRFDNMWVQLYEVFYDNTFVPVLILFDSDELRDFFVRNEFHDLLPAKIPAYDFDDQSIGGTFTNFIFRYIGKSQGIKLRGNFPSHIDQLEITYFEGYIQEIVAMMKTALPKLKNPELPPHEIIAVARDLTFAAEAYRQITYYHKGDHGLSSALVEKLKTGQGMCKIIREALAPYQ